MKVSLIFDATVKPQKKQYCIQKIKNVIQEIRKKDKFQNIIKQSQAKSIASNSMRMQSLLIQQNLNQNKCNHQQVTFREANINNQIFNNITNIRSSYKHSKSAKVDNFQSCQFNYIYQDQNQLKNMKKQSKEYEQQKIKYDVNESICYMKKIEQKIDQQMNFYAKIVNKIDQHNSKLMLLQQKIIQLQSLKSEINKKQYKLNLFQQEQVCLKHVPKLAKNKHEFKYFSQKNQLQQTPFSQQRQFDEKFNKLQNIYNNLIKDSAFNSLFIKFQKPIINQKCKINLGLA